MSSEQVFIKDVLRLWPDITGSRPVSTDGLYEERSLRRLFQAIETFELMLNAHLTNKAMMEITQAEEVELGHRSFNVGESDYASRPIQSWDVWLNWALNPWDADITKRIVRTKQEPGKTPLECRIMDYEKVKHICDERISHLKNGDPYYANFRLPPWATSTD